LSSDGLIDTTFMEPGTGPYGSVYAIAVQSDGKILVGGQFSTYNGASIDRLARINPDGTLDSTFTAGVAGNMPAITTIVIQGDGKILLGGRFATCNGSNRNNLARLNPDGSFDASFLTDGGGTNDIVRSIVVQSDGNLLVGGDFTTVNGVTKNRIVRLWAD
jgi:uncharacterized delta-60 repeat protein